MNAFEDIIKLHLEEEGYWVRQSVKVHHITKEDKRRLNNYSMPTPEIDIVALNAKENELLLVEVKSFLDSQGVYYSDVFGLDGPESWGAKRYRLFANSTFRRIVTERLLEEFLEQGLINKKTKPNYALAAGHIHSSEDELNIKRDFSKRGWRLFSPKEIKDKVKGLSGKGWEDNLVTTTAKLILRDE